MIKTLEPTDATTICDTLSPLAYNKNLRSRERERESTSVEYLFKLVGHEHDLGDGTNLGQFEVNGGASTNEYCTAVKFNIIDAREYALHDRQKPKNLPIGVFQN